MKRMKTSETANASETARNGAVDTARNSAMNKIFILYAALEAVLLIVIMITQYTTVSEIYGKIMFCATLTDGIFMLVYFLEYGRRTLAPREQLIPLAFALMVGADFCVCYLGYARTMAYILFCCLESVYAYYLRSGKKSILFRLALYAVLLGVTQFMHMMNLQNAVGMLNMAILTGNVGCAWLVYRQENISAESQENTLSAGNQKDALSAGSQKNTLSGNSPKSAIPAKIFAIGISVFFFSDCTILIETALPAGHIIAVCADFLTWPTYIAAQVLILYGYVKRIQAAPVPADA